MNNILIELTTTWAVPERPRGSGKGQRGRDLGKHLAVI